MDTKPDIVLIVLDTQRADRLSCYGYGRDTTPHIDAFAEEATLFERAIAPAQWTVPSHASLFTGEYPTTHMMMQTYDTLGSDMVTLAELLRRNEYWTVGFSNNPWIGGMENELDRGFEEIYTYGGPTTHRPVISRARSKRMGRLVERFNRLSRRFTTSILHWFTNNKSLLRFATHSLILPLWQGNVNIKGSTAGSLRDAIGYMRTWHRETEDQPLFVFINLMEAHLPYRPAKRFVQKFAPYYPRNREARDFMEIYNLRHYEWMIPLVEPLVGIADRTLKDLYDAEVAFQDHLLRHLLRYLNRPMVRDNTMVIITADHGEGLNHHHLVGHSMGVYDDLVRVPLLIRYPRLYPAGDRVPTAISTRRLFHSILEAAGVSPNGNAAGKSNGAPIDVEGLSLTRSLNGHDPENGTVFAEGRATDTLLTLLENHDPPAIETFRCRSMRRAAYRERHKLITVDDVPDELFDVIDDPGEVRNLLDRSPDQGLELQEVLTAFLEQAEARRPATWEAARQLRLDDERLADRLRALGYME